jgi:hypothetical protein
VPHPVRLLAELDAVQCAQRDQLRHGGRWTIRCDLRRPGALMSSSQSSNAHRVSSAAVRGPWAPSCTVPSSTCSA